MKNMKLSTAHFFRIKITLLIYVDDHVQVTEERNRQCHKTSVMYLLCRAVHTSGLNSYVRRFYVRARKWGRNLGVLLD